MSALDYLPKLDAAIHADTGHENKLTYEHAATWDPWLGEHGITVINVQPENNDIVRTDWGGGSIQIPAFTESRKRQSAGQIKRQCTRHWKILPLRKAMRELLGTRPSPGCIENWQGISLDECHRMRTSDVKYISNVYPLVEMRMTRINCIEWLLDHKLPVPIKSACVFCPFHRTEYWKTAKRQNDETWRKIVEADQLVRQFEKKNLSYIHPKRLPIEEAVRIPEDVGAYQPEMDLPCDGGVCFV